MSRITLELPIRNTSAEVEVELTGCTEDAQVASIALCDGCIELDIDTIALLMGQDEWTEFVNEAIDKYNAQPIETVSIIGWPDVGEAARLTKGSV